ncbi:MAG: amidohydrolase [Acidobacteria bacterium]|nr:amidohydrolase [Acidobacteriota bacterium]
MLASISLALPAWAQPADWVIDNAVVYTVDAAQPKARAIAVKGERILAVGNDLSRHVGPATRRIDAKGAAIIPGFIDSHGHMANFGESLEILDFRTSASAAEVARAVQKAAQSRPKGEWIRGRAWDQTRFPGGEFPNADDLSAVTPDHPVYLTRVDGHAAWVNRKALEMADVNAATKDPDGGKIIRDASGKPTGILVDRAQGLVSRRIPSAGNDALLRRLRRAAEECARLGLTTVHDAGVSAEVIAAYRSLIAKNALPVRAYAMIGGAGRLWEDWLKRGPEIGPHLTVRSIKLVADGALGSRGAAMKEPYSDEPSNRGLVLAKKEDIERVSRQAAARGFQVNTHAIGDLANRNVLDAYAAALGGRNDKRFRVEHSQIVSLDDMPSFARYSIIASMQATHATSDMRWAEKRVGPNRIPGAYAWERFRKLGVTVANGSDFPVESANPLWGFYASITRQDHDGSPANGWMPDQKMSREEALRSWTITGAYAAFEEKEKGSLQAGKLADFVMLSKDILQVPPKEILTTRVLLTSTGGRIVYQEKQ